MESMSGWSAALTIPTVAAAIATRQAADLGRDFEAMGIPFSPIAKPSDMLSDPHVLREGGLARSTLASGESFRAPSLPFEVDGRMVSGGGDVAAIGQDTEAVLGGLGLSADEIAAARGLAA